MLTSPKEVVFQIVNNTTFIDADSKEYLRISDFKDLVRIALKKPTKLNILRLLACPIVKLRPSLRQLIVIVATKAQAKMSDRRAFSERSVVLVLGVTS
jgi:hypothetical protein